MRVFPHEDYERRARVERIILRIIYCLCTFDTYSVIVSTSIVPCTWCRYKYDDAIETTDRLQAQKVSYEGDPNKVPMIQHKKGRSSHLG